MPLPVTARAALDELLEGTPRATLARAASALSERYRAPRPNPPVVRSRLDALAYGATRLPATYAAAEAVFETIRVLRPGWRPRRLLDVGAGPATATLAAQGGWPSLTDATLLEPNPHMRSVGRRLVRGLPLEARWADTTIGAAALATEFDLVVASYVLGELPNPGAAVARIWAATRGTVVIVEPGTPDGYDTALRARRELLLCGASTLAPCTHDEPCPLEAGDWCHFSRRLPRTRLHRRAKGADRPFEDEKYSYVVLSRTASPPGGSRVIRPPRRRKGLVETVECAPGGIVRRTTSRRQGNQYKEARRLRWGDWRPPD